MDPRRCMTLALLALLPAACAEAPPPMLAMPIAVAAPTLRPAAQPAVLTEVGPPKLMATCRRTDHHKTRRARACLVLQKGAPPPMLTAAPVRALARTSVVVATATSAPPPSRPLAPAVQAASGPHDHMDGAIKVFAYAPGRVFPVATAPLRVTTLTLEPGEALIDKAAGDTVRWEIGDTTSGSGQDVRTLVMLKPLAAGLSTNLVLTTSKRVYLLDLASAARHADTDIAWSYGAPIATAPVLAKSSVVASGAATMLMGQVSGRYRIDPVGRRPSWTPAAVFDDGRRTFIAFGPDLGAHSAPLLFVDGPGGRPALVNYRQAGDLYIVDALFSRAELKLGDAHAEVVRLVKLDGGAS